MRMLDPLLARLSPRQRYLLGYLLLLGAGAGVLTVVMPGQWPGVLGMGLVGAAAGWGVARLSSERLRGRMHRLREATDAIGRGELHHRIDLRGHDDFTKLAESLDRMAAQLEAHIRAREALEKDLDRVEKLALIGELAAIVAHEVNNPLDGLQNAVRILRDAHPPDSQNGRLLDLMDSGLARIERLVQRLLDMARPSTPSLEPVRVEEVLEDALLFVRPRLNRSGIKIERDFPAEPLQVRADRMQLAQVLINLLLNAADAMPEGGRIALTGRNGENGDRVVLEIADTGKGIAAEHVPHIFEPFYTTKRNGTGLGLAVVARIIETHQGRIEVQSEAGKGTRFKMELMAPAGEAAF